MSDAAKPSYFELLRGVVDDVIELARLDARLLVAEMKLSLGAVVKFAVAAVFAVLAAAMSLAFFAVAAYAGLCAWGLSPPEAALLIAFASGVFAVGGMFYAIGRIRNWSPFPRRAVAHFRSSVASISEGLVNARSES